MKDLQYQLIIRFLEKELSAEEKTNLQNWRSVSAENEKRFQEVQFLWQKSQLTQKNAKEISIDVDAALAKVNRQIPQPAKVVNLRRRWIQIAAAAVVTIFVGLFWMINQQSVDMIEVATIANEQKEITLPDESVVWLNENSKLTYPKSFQGNTREVSMQGDLVFEVTHNKQKPFIVKSNDLQVQVLGTKFNVNNSKSNNINSFVHVLNGKVKVQRDDLLGNEVILKKGMTAMLNQKDSLFQTDAFSSNRLFWLNKELVFDNMSLDKVVEDLEYIFDMKIGIENPQILSCPFTGKFGETITIPEILEMMTIVFGVEIEAIKSNHYKIKKGNLCN